MFKLLMFIATMLAIIGILTSPFVTGDDKGRLTTFSSIIFGLAMGMFILIVGYHN